MVAKKERTPGPPYLSPYLGLSQEIYQFFYPFPLQEMSIKFYRVLEVGHSAAFGQIPNSPRKLRLLPRGG